MPDRGFNEQDQREFERLVELCEAWEAVKSAWTGLPPSVVASEMACALRAKRRPGHDPRDAA